jgi:hypothetical protein
MNLNVEGSAHMRMSWTAWFGAAALAGIVVLVRAIGRRTHSQNVDVGSVSDQWVAEHRAGPEDDST